MDDEIDGVLSPGRGGVYIDICLNPGSSRTGIHGVNPWRDCLEIYLTEVPIDGKANLALIELLSDVFGIPDDDIIIVKGKTSRNKRVFLNGLNVYKVSNSLKSYSERK